MLKVVIFPLPSNWFERFLVISVEHDSVCGFIKLWFVVNLLALLFTVNNMHVIWKCKRFGEFFFEHNGKKLQSELSVVEKKKLECTIFDVFLTLSSPHICQKLHFCVCYVGHQEIVQNWLQICFCGQALSRGNYWSIENIQFALRKLEKKALPDTCWFLPPITDFAAL